MKMPRYLLAAEADKIQDFIFRSSRLREVVGGSQLLTRFCEEVPFLLLKRIGDNCMADIIVSDGGSFRILFNNKDTAIQFGNYLSEIYRVATGSTLTVAEPVKIDEPLEKNFASAIDKANFELREEKRKSKGWTSEEHMPFMAICTSCGMGPAVNIYKEEYHDEKVKYLCQPCLNKNLESRYGRSKFLEKIYSIIAEEEKMPLEQYSWPGLNVPGDPIEKDPTEEVADYDSNRYVAYLVADGNDMGEVFGKCQNRETMAKLSCKLDLAIRRALAKPTMKIMKYNQLDNRTNFIPVLPLILGGDELFALIPAPWALDFALSFCRAYEQEMRKVYGDEDIELEQQVPQPTISVAIVICKNKHPYTLAYEAAKANLDKAKQLYRVISLYKNEHYSVINFNVLVGGAISPVVSPKSEYRPTLKPYLVAENAINRWGLSLERIIEERWNLRHLPSKRLHELQNLYDPASNNLPSSHDQFDSWEKRLEQLLERINLRSKDESVNLKNAVDKLGGEKWFMVNRHSDNFRGHGLPDLLEAWNFALCLEKPRREYEEV